MKDIPIIFSASMVLALLREAETPGTGKTMTRRLARKYPKNLSFHNDSLYHPSPWTKVEPGDRLWVRENFYAFGRWRPSKKAGKVTYRFERTHKDTIYAADAHLERIKVGKFGEDKPAWHLRPNIFLEQKDSRLTLPVSATKIERLQDISEGDAVAEGIAAITADRFFAAKYPIGGQVICARDLFEKLWKFLHGPDSWNANPEVVALTFPKVYKQNVLAMKEAA